MTTADMSTAPTSSSDRGAPTLMPLDIGDCWAMLGTGSVGRIVYTDQALPAVRPVTYALDGHHIVFRTVTGSTLARAITDQVVAFEVDDLHPDTHSGWSVVAIGIARLIDTPGALFRATTLGLAPWAGDGRNLFVTITPSTISGRSVGAPRPSR
jgi:hypothetical protein